MAVATERVRSADTERVLSRLIRTKRHSDAMQPPFNPRRDGVCTAFARRLHGVCTAFGPNEARME